MTTDITGADSQHLLDEGWSTPLEAGVRGTIRGFIEALLEEELEAALGRARYARLRTAADEQEETARGLGDGEPAAGSVPSTGHRHGRRERQVLGSFGAIGVAVPRARLATADGRTTEWVNKTLPAYRRRTREVDALIAGAYLAGTNTRRVGRALTAVFRGAISKSTVSRVWRQIKVDWESWNRRDLAPEAHPRRHRGEGAARQEGDSDLAAGGPRTTNAIERLHLEFKRRIKTQTVLPSAETAAMLFWALLAPVRSCPERLPAGCRSHSPCRAD